jgi:hypothetical protein
MVEGEDGLEEEVGGGVEADDNQDDPSVLVGTGGPVGDDEIDVDQDVGEDAVVKQPESE